MSGADSCAYACIMAVWPEYYQEHRSNIDGILRDVEIAKLRADKDVSSQELMEEVEEYSTEEFCRNHSAHISVLQRHPAAT